MRSRKSIVISLLSVAMVFVVAGAWFFGANEWQNRAPDAFGLNEIAKNGTVQGVLYPGNPAREARLVEGEDKRLVYVRTVASVAQWKIDGLSGAYRVSTGSVNTLVLPARDQPYTTADLLVLAPETFVLQEGGSYLLSENIAILQGATLSLESADGISISIRLKSNSESFVSIVALGGSLALGGSATSKASVTSWDSSAAGPDIKTDDGRAYVRVIGGHASLSYAEFSDLGFWSGSTGGVALTGTDTVSTFTAPPGTAPATEIVGATTPVAGAPLLSEAELTARSSGDYSLVSASISHVTFADNAYGLFVTNAKDVLISDTDITGSLVDGLALHRAVSDTVIIRTTSSSNNVDGFSLDRSSTEVLFTRVTANDNGRNGISLDGQSLADGPNAVGTGIREYGENEIRSSSISGNKRYGIEVSGGRDLEMTANTVTGNDVGVVVSHDAMNVEISGNTFTNQVTQSIAVRDGSRAVMVHKNTIVGGNTGVYVRNANASVTGNTLSAISNHGITLVGDVQDTFVANNSLAGYGSQAVWVDTSTKVTVEKNELLDWRPAVTVERVVNSVFQPLTFVWLLLAALLVMSALTRKRQLRLRMVRSPYPERVPLTSLSKGIVQFDVMRDPR